MCSSPKDSQNKRLDQQKQKWFFNFLPSPHQSGPLSRFRLINALCTDTHHIIILPSLLPPTRSLLASERANFVRKFAKIVNLNPRTTIYNHNIPMFIHRLHTYLSSNATLSHKYNINCGTQFAGKK